MSTKNNPLTSFKRIATPVLAFGSSIILGFLSFSGMYVLWPCVPLACFSFVLSIAYEGEIYKQNSNDALDKLFGNRLKKELARQGLLEALTQGYSNRFFERYKSLFKHPDRKYKKQQLKAMEREFSNFLFPPPCPQGLSYVVAINQRIQQTIWSNKDRVLRLPLHTLRETYQEKRAHLQRVFHLLTLFSAVAAVSMSIGTSYLLIEACTTLSFTVAPWIILPLSMIAGAGYGLLTFNSMTKLAMNNPFHLWYQRITEYGDKSVIKTIGLGITVACIGALALFLTVCTAGTWLTIVRNTPPLFERMKKIPSWIIGGGNAMIAMISALAFNVENSSETLEMLTDGRISRSLKQYFSACRESFNTTWKTETWLQFINPIRLFVKLTYMPLRILGFTGHVIGVGVGDDRLDGVSPPIAATINTLNECIEDGHYFFGCGEKHATCDDFAHHLAPHHGHSHDHDIPTQLLDVIYDPLRSMAAGWHNTFFKLPATTLETGTAQRLDFPNT